MVDVGPNSGSTTAETTLEDVSWTNPSNILTQNDTYATVSISAGQTPELLYATGLGFSIPSNATITHVRVEVDMFTNVTPANDFALVVTKNAGASIAGSRPINRFAMPASDSDTYIDTGFATLAQWGMTLSPAEANSADFGGGFWLIFGDTLALVYDHARVSIRYEINPGPPDMQPMPRGRYVRRPGVKLYDQEDTPLAIATLPEDLRFLMGASVQ